MQTIQISGALHHAVRGRRMSTDGKDREVNPGVKFTRNLLCLSYLEHMTNEYVRSTVDSFVSPRDLLAIIER